MTAGYYQAPQAPLRSPPRAVTLELRTHSNTQVPRYHGICKQVPFTRVLHLQIFSLAIIIMRKATMVPWYGSTLGDNINYIIIILPGAPPALHGGSTLGRVRRRSSGPRAGWRQARATELARTPHVPKSRDAHVNPKSIGGSSVRNSTTRAHSKQPDIRLFVAFFGHCKPSCFFVAFFEHCEPNSSALWCHVVRWRQCVRRCMRCTP